MTKQSNPATSLADLRAADQAARLNARDAYASMVQDVAAGRFPSTGTFADTLANAGRTMEDFERAVALFKKVEAARAKAHANAEADHLAEIERCAATLRDLDAERERVLAEIKARRDELEGERSRLLVARRNAERQAGELLRLEAEYGAALDGRPAPAPVPAPEPRFDVQQTAPASPKPAGYDPFDENWSRTYDTAGSITYLYKGRKVS